VHLGLAKVEVDMVVGDDPWEALGDPAHLDDRGLGQRRAILDENETRGEPVAARPL
jgi:hypothetical protein